MIISNVQSPFGKVAKIQTDAFSCSVSTLQGWFKGSTAVMANKPDGSLNKFPVAKAYLKRSLSRADRDQIHDYIVNSLDELGVDGSFDLNAAIEGTFSVAKARGLIQDYIARRAR
jgi:hypothetical protein